MDSPCLVVDLDRTGAAPAEDLRRARDSGPDRVVLGVAAVPGRVPGEHVESCDVLLTDSPAPSAPWVCVPDPRRAARRLADVAADQPEAAVALAQVLRMGPALAPQDRLVAESLAYSMLQSGAGFGRWLDAAPHRTPRPAAEPVRLHRDGDTLSVTLDRPWARNAMDARTRDALCEALALAVDDPSIARIDLSGTGPAFCAGGDLAEFGTSADPARAHRIRVGRSPAALLQRCGTRVTAHLHGACIGAGIELPAFADRIVAAPDTVIRLPEIAMGLIPGAGGTASIPVRIGRHRTAYLALSGAPLDAATALTWGLVDAVTA